MGGGILLFQQILMIVLITGASSGIGLSAAKRLASQGHKVYGAARRVELMEGIPGVVPVRLDLTSEASVAEAVKFVLQAEGRIDALVNNAGYGSLGPVETVPMEEARRQMDVNLFGLAAMVKAVLPVMRGQGFGRIINLSSIAGRVVMPMCAWYNVSKYSVESLSDNLRMDLRRFGIRVSLIEPGGIRTPWGDIAASHLEDSVRGTAYEDTGLREARVLRKGYSMRVLSSPEVVARAICRAVNSRHPRARYRVGAGSRLIITLHTLLPTRWWDSLCRSFMSLKV